MQHTTMMAAQLCPSRQAVPGCYHPNVALAIFLVHRESLRCASITNCGNAATDPMYTLCNNLAVVSGTGELAFRCAVCSAKSPIPQLACGPDDILRADVCSNMLDMHLIGLPEHVVASPGKLLRSGTPALVSSTSVGVQLMHQDLSKSTEINHLEVSVSTGMSCVRDAIALPPKKRMRKEDASTSPVSIAELVQSMIDDNILRARGSRRPSALSPRPGASATTPVSNMVTILPFLNRVHECAQLVKAFHNLWSLRGRVSWQDRKPYVEIPVVVGISGLGKTTFARKAVLHLVEHYAGKTFENDLAVTAAIDDELVAAIIREHPAQRFYPEHLRTLLLELAPTYFNWRNILIDAEKYRTSGARSIAHFIAGELLSEFLRFHYDMQPSTELMPELYGFSSLRVVLDYITGSGKYPTIITIDEGQSLPDDVGAVVVSIATCAVEHNLPVYVCVVGVGGTIIRQQISSTRARCHNIFLPVLEPHHMWQIMESLGMLKAGSTPPPAIAAVLWWLGGIPWSLHMLLAEAAKIMFTKTGLATMTLDVVLKLLAADRCTLADILTKTAEWVDSETFADPPWADIFSLAVAEVPVPPTLKMAEITVDAAQLHGMLYWDGIEGNDEGIVLLSALMLRRSVTSRGQRISLLTNIVAPQCASDNELTLIAIVMHKLKGFALAGLTTLNLQDICADLPDITVDVPVVFEVHVLDDQYADYTKISELLSTVRRPGYAGKVAFVHKRYDALTDSFIVFQHYILVFQEQPSVRANQSALLAEAVPLLLGAGSCVGAGDSNTVFVQLDALAEPFTLFVATDERLSVVSPGCDKRYVALCGVWCGGDAALIRLLWRRPPPIRLCRSRDPSVALIQRHQRGLERL
jgi:hypothetical protein